ncbi:MAG: anthranilate synthase component I family protein, partial [Prevotellaceae bacterium]|nr:anthranilate synthase component I family protein [Prevotellaceae bacterium]
MRLLTESKTVLADLQTPVGIYLKVRDVFPESTLLESSDFHGNDNAVSVIGVHPFARFEVNNGIIRSGIAGAMKEAAITPDAPLVAQMNDFIRSFEPETSETRRYNGFFGYTA